MGGEREVRQRCYRGRGDRKPLCNHVKLEIRGRDQAERTELYLSSAAVKLLGDC